MKYMILFLMSITTFASDTTHCMDNVAKYFKCNLNNESGLSEEAKQQKEFKIFAILVACLENDNDANKTIQYIKVKTFRKL